jgi:hypothetical protein
MKKKIFIDLLSKFLNGQISVSQAINQWPDYRGLPDARLLKHARFELSWFETDSDIRSKEPSYEAAQLARIQKCLEKLKKSKAIY